MGFRMDELDRRLIALLRADGRVSAVALAKILKVSRGTVQNRIDRLTAEGVILGFTVRLHPEAEPGRVRAIMSIAVEGRRAPAVMLALQGFPERWDVVAELSAASLEAFSRALDEIRLIDGIASSETSLLLESRRV
jgi:DNA-binding Lrp family transcriptional regulator